MRKLKKVKVAGELLKDAKEKARVEKRWKILGEGRPPKKPGKKYDYVDELARLQFELLDPQAAVVAVLEHALNLRHVGQVGLDVWCRSRSASAGARHDDGALAFARHGTSPSRGTRLKPKIHNLAGPGFERHRARLNG